MKNWPLDLNPLCLFTGPAVFTTECDLIAPGLNLPGTFSMTNEDVFFEVNEASDEYKKVDPAVSGL